MLYYLETMKFLKLLLQRNKKASRPMVDFYQDAIQLVGKDQIKRLAEKGLSIPIVML